MKPTPASLIDRKIVHASLSYQRSGALQDKEWRGIGMMMDQDSLGRKFVRYLFKDGPCMRLGSVQPGDLVTMINGVETYSLTLKECRALITESESQVLLRLSRPTSPWSRSRSNSLETDTDNTLASEADTDQKDSESDDGVDSAQETVSGVQLNEHLDDIEDFAVSVPVDTVHPASEDLLETFSYIKGSGNLKPRRFSFGKPRIVDERWVAIRGNKLLITKGANSRITKVLDIPLCDPVYCIEGANGELFVAVKTFARPTFFFGSHEKNKIERLLCCLKQLQRPVEQAAEPASVEMPTGQGFCAFKFQVPEDYANDYCQLK